MAVKYDTRGHLARNYMVQRETEKIKLLPPANLFFLTLRLIDLLLVVTERVRVKSCLLLHYLAHVKEVIRKYKIIQNFKIGLS